MRVTIIIMMMLINCWVRAQHFSEKITKEFAFENKLASNTLMIANINGNIKVVGYDGDKIVLEMIKEVRAKTEAWLEKGKQEVNLGVIGRADTLMLYVKDDCNIFGRKNERNENHLSEEGWGYNWNCNNGNCKQEYEYKMDFLLKVPASSNLIVSTINDGNIDVEKINGVVKASNVNGSIHLSNLKREAVAHAINGNVDIEYTNNPQKRCRFYSLNGDINALFEKGLAANLSFESFNGNFYTNVASIKPLPLKVQKASHGEGIKYKVNGSRYQIGHGGVLLDFETFNGNVYLKEK